MILAAIAALNEEKTIAKILIRAMKHSLDRAISSVKGIVKGGAAAALVKANCHTGLR